MALGGPWTASCYARTAKDAPDADAVGFQGSAVERWIETEAFLSSTEYSISGSAESFQSAENPEQPQKQSPSGLAKKKRWSSWVTAPRHHMQSLRHKL